MRLRRRARVLLALVGAAFLAGTLVASPGISAAGLVLAGAYLLAKWSFEDRLSRVRLTARRRLLSPIAHVDEPIDVECALEGELAGLHARWRDVLPDPLQPWGEHDETSTLRRLRASRHGGHVVGPVEVTLSDPAGLFEATVRLPGELHVPVLVSRERFAKGRAAARRLRFSALRDDAVGRLVKEFHPESVRNYEGGDRLRDIDWKRSSRMDRLMTKTYERGSEAHVMLLVDASRSMRASDGRADLLHAAFDLCAEAAEMASSQGLAIAAIVADEARVLVDRPLRGDRGASRALLTHLARAPPPLHLPAPPGADPAGGENDEFLRRLRELHPGSFSGERSYRALASRIAARHPPGSLLVLAFSDLAVDGRAFADALVGLRRAGHAVALVALSGGPLERGPASSLNEVETRYRRIALRRALCRRLTARGVRVVDHDVQEPRAGRLDPVSSALR